MIDKEKKIFSLSDGLRSVRFVASADVHLGKKLYNIPELEEDIKDNFIQLCDLALTLDIEYLVICGDLFDNNLPSARTVAFVRTQVERLWHNGIRMIGIAGDHDKPIHGTTWCSISGLYPVTICPEFAGFDYYNTSSGMENVMAALMENRELERVNWIFLHCQFPQLFERTEDKKKIDFGEVHIFEAFPNLMGVIAGDIHAANIDGVIIEKDKTAFLGYTGSLGVTAMDEVENRSVIYCDGEHLRRLPIEVSRPYVNIDFREVNMTAVDPSFLIKTYQNHKQRPVFSITYDAVSEPLLGKLNSLYTVGHVKTKQVKKNMITGLDELVVDERPDINTTTKIDAALRESCTGNNKIYLLLSDMLAATEPKEVLDEFKASVVL